MLVLRRDGSATITVSGNARQGRPDRTAQGHIAAADFDQLASLLQAQGFFTLEDSYEEPSIRDGAWRRIAVSAPDKQVFSREDAGPPALRRIMSAIDAARARIRFAP